MSIAEDIAKKYAGQMVQCKPSLSTPPTNMQGETFEGKVVGRKLPTEKDPVEYIILELPPPLETNFKIIDLLSNPKARLCVAIFLLDRSRFGKRVYCEEIMIDGEFVIKQAPGKKISDWPGKCNICGSPAFVSLNRIDCSSVSCSNKFKTNSGTELFLPVQLRQKVKKG